MQQCHLVKLINISILQAKKYYLLIKVEYKFSYSPLGKALENQLKTIGTQGKKQVEALKILKLAENEQKPKSIDGIFPKDLEQYL